MNKIYNPEPKSWSEILKRPTQSFKEIEETVKGIFKEIQTNGDEAVAKYTSLFDGIYLEILRGPFFLPLLENLVILINKMFKIKTINFVLKTKSRTFGAS